MIRKIRDVRGVRVSAREDDISEIHIVAAPGRPPSRIVRDVVSAINVSLERNVDYRKISIVQLDDADAGTVLELPHVAVAAPAGPRLRYGGVTLALHGGRAQVEVELKLDAVSLRGTSNGRPRQGSMPHMVADATLRAVEQCVDPQVDIELEDVVVVQTSLGAAIVVAVRVVDGRTQRELVGTALERGDVHQAAAVAALDAVNRVLGSLPLKDPVEYVVE